MLPNLTIPKLTLTPVKPLTIGTTNNNTNGLTSLSTLSTVNPSKGVEIVLRDYQVDHVNRMVKMLSEPINGFVRRFVIDSSHTGHGKTITTLKVLKELEKKYGIKYEAFIIAPKTLFNNWETNAKKYGVDILYINTPQSLVGRESGISNIYLKNDVDGNIVVTPNFLELLKTKNIFFIYDEFDYAKNKSRISEGITAIARALYDTNNKYSRGIYISATVIDKAEMAKQLLKMLGILKHDYIVKYNVSDNTYDYDGLNDILTVLKNVIPSLDSENKAKANQLIKDAEPSMAKNLIDAKRASKIVLEAYNDYIKPFLLSNMPLQEFKRKQYRYNGNFYVPSTEVYNLRKHINKLAKLSGYEDENGGGVMISKLVKILVKINNDKLIIALYQGLRVLKEDNTKLIIFVNYINDLNWLTNAYRKLGYVAESVYGDTKADERIRIFKKFQEPNKDLRVLISHFKVGGRGVELDSQYPLEEGGYIPYMFIMPSYSYSDLVQLAGRTHRALSETDSYLFHVYGDPRQVPEEKNILQSIARKKLIIESFNIHGKKDVLPGDYEKYYEYDNLPTKDPEDYAKIMEIVSKPVITKEQLEEAESLAAGVEIITP